MAAYRFVNQDGSPVVAELRLFPREPEFKKKRPAGEWSAQWVGVGANAPRGGLGSRILRKIRVATHVQEFHKLADWWARRGKFPKWAGRIASLAAEIQTPLSRHARPGSNSDEMFFATVAGDYVRVARHPTNGRRPIAEMAAHFGLPQGQIRKWVHRSRELGL